MFVKQVLFLITLTVDKRHTFLQMYNPCQKSWYTYEFLHTDDLRVSRTFGKHCRT